VPQPELHQSRLILLWVYHLCLLVPLSAFFGNKFIINIDPVREPD
jgi:hypothetical protein